MLLVTAAAAAAAVVVVVAVVVVAAAAAAAAAAVVVVVILTNLRIAQCGHSYSSVAVIFKTGIRSAIHVFQCFLWK